MGRGAGLALAAAVVALACMPASAGAESVDARDTYLIGKVTGPGPLNFTAERWNVWGTDLGHMFEHEGRVYMTFGDTVGVPRDIRLDHFRSNAMAYLRSSNPRVGPLFGGMITDGPLTAAELLSVEDEPAPAVTVIPTYGTSVGGRMVLHYMSVREWGSPGHWTLNRSGLAFSDDDGRRWAKDADATWPGESNFGQVAIVQVGGRAYLFGIPGGRFGGVKLARVDAGRLLDPSALEYWNGSSWTTDPAEVEGIVPSSSLDTPSERRSDHGLVVPPPVGELSVQWNSHYRKWLMMYSRGNPGDYAAVIRTADCLTGPWGPERVVATGAQYPTLYAPYIPPRWNDGPDVYFAMSIFGVNALVSPAPYNVFWMHTSLDGVQPAPDERCVAPRGSSLTTWPIAKRRMCSSSASRPRASSTSSASPARRPST